MNENTKKAIETYKNALTRYESLIKNLKSQLEDLTISEKLKKDVEEQIKQAEDQYNTITTSLKILENKEDK